MKKSMIWMILISVSFSKGLTDANPMTVEPKGAEAKVIRNIFRGYDKHARPVENPARSIELEAQFILAALGGLDAKHQTLSTSGTFTLLWKDEFLKWDPEDYNGTAGLVLDSKLVWLPEIFVFNTADDNMKDYGLETHFRVEVSSDGRILWNIYDIFVTQCDVSLFMFPFDTQTCRLQFASFFEGEKNAKVHFSLASREINKHLYTGSSGWNIVDSKIENSSVQSTGDEYATVTVTLKLERKPTYYVMNVIIPSGFLSYLSIFVFLLPNESGEKISLQVTVVLSYVMLLLMVADITPSTGKEIPLIVYYLIGFQCTATICLLLTIFVVNVYHRTSDHPVSPTWKKITYLLSKVACIPQNLQIYQARVASMGDNSQKGVNNEWNAIAKVLDKFFFLVAFVVVTVCNVAVLASIF